MKHLGLVLLLCLVSCGKQTKSESNSFVEKGNPLVSLPVLEATEVVAPEVISETVVAEEKKSLECDFSNENDFKTFSIKIENNMASLPVQDGETKLVFDHHIFSPSGNENATIHHEDKNFMVDGGDVKKINARIILNDQNIGELQVTYKIQLEDKSMVQTEYRKLADINNCR